MLTCLQALQKRLDAAMRRLAEVRRVRASDSSVHVSSRLREVFSGVELKTKPQHNHTILTSQIGALDCCLARYAEEAQTGSMPRPERPLQTCRVDCKLLLCSTSQLSAKALLHFLLRVQLLLVSFK